MLEKLSRCLNSWKNRYVSIGITICLPFFHEISGESYEEGGENSKGIYSGWRKGCGKISWVKWRKVSSKNQRGFGCESGHWACNRVKVAPCLLYEWYWDPRGCSKDNFVSYRISTELLGVN